jgi:hypothetical protein
MKQSAFSVFSHNQDPLLTFALQQRSIAVPGSRYRSLWGTAVQHGRVKSGLVYHIQVLVESKLQSYLAGEDLSPSPLQGLF